MITLDSPAVTALIGPNDVNHGRATTTLAGGDEPRVIPTAALGEIGYFVERRHGQRVLRGFVDDLLSGAYYLDAGLEDLHRVSKLVDRYADLPLGLVDAAVIACAERNGGRVLTFDYRHFGAVAREGTITLGQ